MAKFEKQTLIQGKKLYDAGNVNLKRNGNYVSARVNDGNTFIVSFNITKNNKISQMKCSCQQKNCVHQAAVAYAFNDDRKGQNKPQTIQNTKSPSQPSKKVESKPVQKEPVKKAESKPVQKKPDIQIPDHLSLDKCFVEIKKTAKRERDISQLFMKELDKRLLKAMSQKNAVKQVTQLVSDFYKITNYPKKYRNKVINRFKQSFDLMLDIHQKYKEIFTWLLDNRAHQCYLEFDDYFQTCIEHLDDETIYKELLSTLKDHNLNNNPYLYDILQLYFKFVMALDKNLSVALIDIAKYKDQSIYQYYEIRNLIDQNCIDEASKAYNRAGNKKDPMMLKIKEELDTFKVDLDDEMDEILRSIRRMNSIKDIKEQVAQFKKTCGKEWSEYKELFLNQLAQVTSESHYVLILSQEREWYLAAKKVLYNEDMNTFDKYNDILWDNNKEVYYLLFMHCIEIEILHSNGRYYFVTQYLRKLVRQRGVDQDIVIQMTYDLISYFPTRKALIRELNELLDGGLLNEYY